MFWNYDGTNAGSCDIFVQKYNSSGTNQWTKQLGTSSCDEVWQPGSTVTDSSGNIYVTGQTAGNLDGNTNSGSEDIFLLKYNSSGTKQWTKQIGSSSSDSATGLAIDNSSNIYVVGYTEGGLDNNTNLGNRDFFILKYNSSGVLQ